MTYHNVPVLEGINDYYNQPYSEIYRHVIDIAKDARRLDTTTGEGIEKCKWVAAMIDLLFDAAMHNAARILRVNNINFDYKEFISEYRDETQARRYKNRTISEYKYVYELMWCLDFVSAEASDTDIEKSRWIMAMCEVLSEINMDVVYPAFERIGFHFDWEVFAKEHDLL